MSDPVDPRLEYLIGVKFEDIAIKEYPKLAFFCGGPPISVFDTVQQKTLFYSLRAFIYDQLTAHGYATKCKNAEDIKDWNHYNIYSDLIEFEKDIAHICRSIILFVESAGSIAELGSFSMIPEIARKLQVFIDKKQFKEASFIELGPVLKLQNINSNFVHIINWNTTRSSIAGDKSDVLDITDAKFAQINEYICDQIKNSIENPEKSSKESDEYVRAKEILFIHDLAIIFQAVTIDEITEYFKQIDYQIRSQNIERAIFCLTKLELLKLNVKGNKKYLTPIKQEQQRYISIQRAAELRHLNDSARLEVKIAQYYSHKVHAMRRSAIEEIEG